MEVYSSRSLYGSPELKNLSDLLENWKSEGPRKELDFAEFERQVRAAVMALERRTIQEGLQHLDVAFDKIKAGDEVFSLAYSKPFEAVYVCLAGEIRVNRHLYRLVDGTGKAFCPLELRAGIVESSWTPQAGAFPFSWSIRTPSSGLISRAIARPRRLQAGGSGARSRSIVQRGADSAGGAQPQRFR